MGRILSSPSGWNEIMLRAGLLYPGLKGFFLSTRWRSKNTVHFAPRYGYASH